MYLIGEDPDQLRCFAMPMFCGYLPFGIVPVFDAMLAFAVSRLRFVLWFVVLVFVFVKEILTFLSESAVCHYEYVCAECLLKTHLTDGDASGHRGMCPCDSEHFGLHGHLEFVEPFRDQVRGQNQQNSVLFRSGDMGDVANHIRDGWRSLAKAQLVCQDARLVL